MRKFSRLGAVWFGVIVMVFTLGLPGCQTGNTYSRAKDTNTFEQSGSDGPSCRFG
jgi:hypothetical protein